MALTLTFIACSGEDGADGLTGLNGINCWDLNANGINDANEDTNADGKWDVKDCQGTKGDTGDTGGDGNNGDNGDDGIDCWDLDADGINDPEEDINGDEKFDGLDCQGADGDPGTNGDNANVIRRDIDMSGFTGIFHIIGIEDELGIAVEDQDNFTYLFYITTIEDNVIFYPVPGKFPLNGAFRETIVAISQNVRIDFINPDNSTSYNIPQGDLLNLRIVAIENSVVINKNGNNGGNVMAQLKAAGVDTSDYYAVMAYFGLKE